MSTESVLNNPFINLNPVPGCCSREVKKNTLHDFSVHFPQIEQQTFLKKQIDSHKGGTINVVYKVVLIIIKIALGFFRIKIEGINRKLDVHYHSARGVEFCEKIIRNLTFNPSLCDREEMAVINLHSTVEEGSFIYKMLENRQTKEVLFRANQELKNGKKSKFIQLFNELPKGYQQAIYALIELQNKREVRGEKSARNFLGKNPEYLLGCKNDQGANIIEQSIHVYNQLENAQRNLIFNIADHREKGTDYPTRGVEEQYMYKLEKIFTNLSSEQTTKGIFDCSIDRMQTAQSENCEELPLDITMIGVEYSGLLKEGGLAEAVEGMATALAKDGKNKVRLIFPKYSALPKKILENLKKSEKPYVDSNQNPIDVYKTDIDGVEILLIDHPTFELTGEKVSIYGPNEQAVKLRWAAFSELAADVARQLEINEKRKQVIHLHDCHVAGVALKLKSRHGEDWESGKIPPIVFTFHNNSRAAQMRNNINPYNYSPAIKALQEDNKLKYINGNPFVEVLDFVDASTTVSETFAEETQDPVRGEGLSFAIRAAAKKGKLIGVINGVNTNRWNPETDKSLKNWKDLDTGKALDLTYGVGTPNIAQKKNQAKHQLEKWIKTYLPYGRNIKEDQSNLPESFRFDPNKPIVTYMGRFDSYQKGLDKLDEAIDSTLKNGGQFILMGSLEDPAATAILDRLEKKYSSGVLFIRDYKDKNGAYFLQQGNASQNRPGIGSVIRAASNFTFIPSSFEPCGLIQFEGWLFGSLAIGAKTGGLADTIIPREKNADSFNGYLFRRDGHNQMSASEVVSKALNEISNLSEAELNAILKRVMRDAKKYGWNDSLIGLSPARKYEIIYQNAIRSISNGSRRKGESIDLTHFFHKKMSDITDRPSKEVLSEEAYLEAFYTGNANSEELDKQYRALNRGLASQLPCPYGRGVQSDLHHRFGGHLTPQGAEFSVFAPHAKTVLVELYDDRANHIITTKLQKDDEGVWKGALSEAKEGYKYRYKINDVDKIDPFGRLTTETREKEVPYSVLTTKNSYEWNDANWMSDRINNKTKSQPTSIYEVHPTTWMKGKDGKSLNYKELGKKLIEHCKKEEFTHVELMGILEHPCEDSMGYQVTGLFSPNSRLGTPDDFRTMVDELHRNKIGVILDWVPAHFANDQFGLKNFDGQGLFSKETWASMFSKTSFWEWLWGTNVFDFSKSFVREFLISSAMYWVKEMHIDMLRIDAVRCMIESHDRSFAKLFIRDLNATIHTKGEGALTIAEDYSGSLDTTSPLSAGGLGFDMEWNLGWMKHVLDFFQTDPTYRKGQSERLKMAVMSNQMHSNVLALSHDQQKEVRNLLSSKNRNYNYKELLSFMFTVPGKKLMFMGMELGNDMDWKKQIGQQMGILDGFKEGDQNQQQILALVHDLNTIYKEQPALYEADRSGGDVEWLNQNQADDSVAFRRKSEKEGSIACFHNLSNQKPIEYTISSEESTKPAILFSSDNKKYGGNGAAVEINEIFKGEKVVGYSIVVPPQTTILVKEGAKNVC